jgi:hypothetical protein
MGNKKEIVRTLIGLVPTILKNFGIGDGTGRYTDAHVTCFLIGYMAGDVKGEVGEVILRRAAQHIIDRHPKEFDESFTTVIPGGGTLH